MRFEEFKAGTFVQQGRCKNFVPSPVNHSWSWEDRAINSLLEAATHALGELNAFSLIVPDVDLFIKMHILKEANTSSRIEGTQTRMDEVLVEREQIDPEKRDDWQEVQNYATAMTQAVQGLETLPLSTRLLRQTHATLLHGVRGESRAPGEFRRDQNWIGGTSLEDAIFIPPPHTSVPDLMSDLEAFWHNEAINVPHLVRIAISHYQFETIHPFQDGNGRIGRLMVPLYFISKGILAKPSLYLSDYLERHKGAYYDALTAVRTNNNLCHWVKFFLVSVRETAIKGRATFQKILELRERVEPQILELGRRAKNARKLLTHLYGKPYVSVNESAKLLTVSHQTANALIREFTRLGILHESTGYGRNRLFFFDDYVSLFL